MIKAERVKTCLVFKEWKSAQIEKKEQLYHSSVTQKANCKETLFLPTSCSSCKMPQGPPLWMVIASSPVMPQTSFAMSIHSLLRILMTALPSESLLNLPQKQQSIQNRSLFLLESPQFLQWEPKGYKFPSLRYSSIPEFLWNSLLPGNQSDLVKLQRLPFLAH